MITTPKSVLRPRARLKTAPTVEPVTATEAKQHSNVFASDEDDMIERKLKAARQLAEGYTGRAFLSQTWECGFDLRAGFGPTDDFWYAEVPPASYRKLASLPRVIQLPRPPLISVSSIVYYLDSDPATSVAFSSSKYYSITADKQNHGRLALKTGEVWPTDLRELDSLIITFLAGYGTTDADVPDAIKEGILMWAAYLYEQREGMPADNAGGAIVLNRGAYIPAGVQAALKDYMVDLL